MECLVQEPTTYKADMHNIIVDQLLFPKKSPDLEITHCTGTSALHDGNFELMLYQLLTPTKFLLWLKAAVESHHCFTANNVEIWVPIPDDAKVRYPLVSPSCLREVIAFVVGTGIITIPHVHQPSEIDVYGWLCTSSSTPLSNLWGV
ncbi:hypothetical protein F5141DRAFT_1062070 [Pisolithus sp. B1]|nr:hypothetical protein F5141DRAFT_1062070 [Pisolithus sp. B1]